MQYRVFGLSTLLLAVLSLVSPATAQRPAAGILAGVDSVDAQIALTWGSGIPRLEEATVRSRLQTVFELELRERGIVVTKAAPNYLILSLTVLNNDDGSISYRHDISLYELGLPKRVILDWVLGSVESMDFKRWNTLTKSDSARVSLEMGARMWEGLWRAYNDTSTTNSTVGWVITWYGLGGVVHVGRNNLPSALEKATIEMAQAFANAYMSVHPRR